VRAFSAKQEQSSYAQGLIASAFSTVNQGSLAVSPVLHPTQPIPDVLLILEASRRVMLHEIALPLRLPVCPARPQQHQVMLYRPFVGHNRLQGAEA
jgi:hypothetical protein